MCLCLWWVAFPSGCCNTHLLVLGSHSTQALSCWEQKAEVEAELSVLLVPGRHLVEVFCRQHYIKQDLSCCSDSVGTKLLEPVP